MLSIKQGGIKYYFVFFFFVFGMARPGIEPSSPGPLANILPTNALIIWNFQFEGLLSLISSV